MAQVTIEINGRPYVVGCGEGEEERLFALARYVDMKVRDLAGQVGAVGEPRLFLLTCLMLADELGEAHQAAAASLPDPTLTREAVNLRARVTELEQRLADREEAFARALEGIARRLTSVADRIAPLE
jgi:cell division protein ZapA